ncbi:MAG TPA: family 16 glycoside hydrolase [Anaerolineales bacterium]|nr:family 16 glycoside hydrolase [Anaerolineales bacterium]
MPTAVRVLASLGGLALIGLSIWLSSPGQLAKAPVETSVADGSNPPLATASPLVPATGSTAAPIATVDAATSSDILIEDFTKGSQYWETGIKDDDRRTASRSLVDGVFRWQVTSKQDISTGIGSKLPALSDFELETTLKLVDGSEAIEYGVQFRNNDAGSYYFFIAPSGQYVLSKYSAQDGEYTDLIPWTQSTAINLNGENKLRVHAVGSKIRLYINGTLVADYVDNSFATGHINIGAWLDTGEKLTLDMTSFKVMLLSP